MRLAIVAIFASAFMLNLSGIALACEAYKALEAADLKEYRDKLTEPEADPLDRLFAFEELACSDRPAVRAFAIREGLKNTSDDLVRQQIMFEALMQKSRIDVELVGSSNITKADKIFIEQSAGVYSRNVEGRNIEEGCIGLGGPKCYPRDSIFIFGSKVEYNFSGATGVFELTGQNELVGYFRAGNNPKYGKIPARIRLF